MDDALYHSSVRLMNDDVTTVRSSSVPTSKSSRAGALSLTIKQ